MTTADLSYPYNLLKHYFNYTKFHGHGETVRNWGSRLFMKNENQLTLAIKPSKKSIKVDKKIPYNLQFTVNKIDRELWLPSIARYVVVINISLTTKK